MGIATSPRAVAVDLWLADPERVFPDPAAPRARRESRATWMLARWALARRFGTRPADVRLSRDAEGRPRLDTPDAAGVSFSLSHTRDLVVCGLADAAAGIGVDVEQRRPRASATVIADRFFCPEEARALAHTPAPRRSDRFWALWTLKEALVKAAGLDLFDGLSACAFRLRGGRVSHVFPSPRRAPRGAWRFALLSPNHAHFVALAVRVARGRRLEVRCHDVTDRLVGLRDDDKEAPDGRNGRKDR
jgi:4'-phosphopantetheinyl transferase